MDRVLNIKYYEKDKLCTEMNVNYTRGTVDVVNFTSDIVSQALGKREATIENVSYFLEERVFEEGRKDKEELLESIGLTNFDPRAICNVTHGMLSNDMFWLSFNDDISYSEIAKLRQWI